MNFSGIRDDDNKRNEGDDQVRRETKWRFCFGEWKLRRKRYLIVY